MDSPEQFDRRHKEFQERLERLRAMFAVGRIYVPTPEEFYAIPEQDLYDAVRYGLIYGITVPQFDGLARHAPAFEKRLTPQDKRFLKSIKVAV
jgi:hypothetical protein